MCKKNIIAALALVITGAAHATTSNGVAGEPLPFTVASRILPVMSPPVADQTLPLT